MADLIRDGADVNAKDADGYPLIDCAVYDDQPEALKALLDSGADARAALDKPGRGRIHTGLEYARMMGYTRILDILNAALASKPEPAAPALPQPALSREDMQKMIDEAAQKAASKQAQSLPPPKAELKLKSDVDTPAYHEPAHPDDLALVVGVEKYNDLPSAEFAERDANAVRDHLLALGYPARRVILLTGPAASRAGLVKNLEKRLPDMVKEDSTVFFYYSGHGSPDAASGKAYLVPADGDPQFLEETAYPMARLYQKLGALKARRVIVALDSCFSGAGGRSVLPAGTRPLVTKIDEGQVPAKIVSLTASASNQISGTIAEQGHGAFTYFLLKGLSEGRRSTNALYEYLKPQVEDSARLQNRDQSPMMTGADAAIQ